MFFTWRRSQQDTVTIHEINVPSKRVMMSDQVSLDQTIGYSPISLEYYRISPPKSCLRLPLIRSVYLGQGQHPSSICTRRSLSHNPAAVTHNVCSFSQWSTLNQSREPRLCLAKTPFLILRAHESTTRNVRRLVSPCDTELVESQVKFNPRFLWLFVWSSLCNHECMLPFHHHQCPICCRSEAIIII